MSTLRFPIRVLKGFSTEGRATRRRAAAVHRDLGPRHRPGRTTALPRPRDDRDAGRAGGAGARRTERLRVPRPLILSHVPSGRGATEQPNVTGDGETSLTPAFWLALALTGVAAGLLGALLMLLLFQVQEAAFGYRGGTFQSGVEAAGAFRRIVSLLVAGVVGGVAWYLLRRATTGERSEIDDALWRGDGRLAWRRSLGTSLISEVVIGMGASLGREAAPKTMGGTAASLVADRLRLSTAQRRLLVACGGGAGLAAVYNVPLGGALFTAELLLGAVTLPVILPALACSAIATLTARVCLPGQATYLNVPDYHVSAAVVVWALLAGPVIGLASAGYIRLVGWVSYHQARGRTALAAPSAAFAVLGTVGIRYPQLLGNGMDMAHDAFLGAGTVSLFAALFLLKPLVTSLCLAGGASGGLFTPVLSTGAVLGALLGAAWSQLWPGSPIGAYALVGAAAMIGAGMQAPMAGLVLVLELTHTGFDLMLPMVAATVTATAVARRIDGYSIYSARLPAAAAPARPRSGPAAGVRTAGHRSRCVD